MPCLIWREPIGSKVVCSARRNTAGGSRTRREPVRRLAFAGRSACKPRRFAAAGHAFQRFIDTDTSGPILAEAAQCLAREDGRKAETIFRKILHENPNHIGALCGLAAISLGAGFHGDAQRLLKHALTQSAHMPLIRRGLAQPILTPEISRRPRRRRATLFSSTVIHRPAGCCWAQCWRTACDRKRRSMPTPKRSTSIRPSFAWNFREATC
jgi:hypothetical protein